MPGDGSGGPVCQRSGPPAWVRETLGMGQVRLRLGSEAGIAHPPWAPQGVGLGPIPIPAQTLSSSGWGVVSQPLYASLCSSEKWHQC